MRTLLRFPLVIMLAPGAFGLWWYARSQQAGQLPDEKKVAMEQLVDRQTGPGYFHAPDPAPDENGIVWIDPASAGDQIEGILRERKRDAADAVKLEKLIEETSAPHPSRVVGGNRINVARLNVALDALP